MGKDPLVDPLVSIPDLGSRLIPPGPEGTVDMAGPERLYGLEFPINGELADYIEKER
jgi:hypothetical protein